ncbi:glycerol-3-phosphate 1-O-acyltransferase PlsY [Motilimonas cestriensis]|uniref:Glycerol-3-phosphate acyltransferase n=1 Tax=Motilimonas cestriensis TaxID=2742685 RepID=A0ABS8WF56_9GAMM|nr:glycerol-3-phosphate 1-O-acyltransferase PlsY [Motilimonas cestriensis]MCE2595985.1 glycerol-3-phosphate 1-O-acyltransferase PlsY [Motilimonas cestriensis]
MTATVIIFIFLAYLIGSVSSAVLICRLKKLPDPRVHGSNNPGTTNVLRLGGPQAAAWVLLADLLKGTIPVYCAYWAGFEPVYIGLVGVAACLGHIYPIFFHFKGGKAVATSMGAMLPLGMDVAGLLVGCWLLVVALSGYSSLAAIITALAAPVFTYFIKPEYTLPVSMLGCLVILRHHENIARLYNGTELKIWRKFSMNKSPDTDKQDTKKDAQE